VSHKKSLGLLAAVGFAGLVVASCGSSNGGGPGDAGTIQHKDGGEVIVGTGDAGEGGTAIVADGTTGKACKSDADCSSPSGPGINKCSAGSVGTFAGVHVQFYSTPVCTIPPAAGGNCDPAPPSDPMGMGLHFCDGADNSNSPGLCYPLTQPPVSGQGSCEVACKFALDGSAPTGCAGKNRCLTLFYSFDPQSGAVVGGGGICQGSCEQDSDCSALNTTSAGTGDAGGSWVCQTDIGLCTQHLVPRKKQIGQACAQSARPNDLTSGACNCQLVNQTTGAGYCTTYCVVGGNPCPNGWICDARQDAVLPDGTSLQVQNTLTQGLCVPGCSLAGDGGVSVEAGGGSDAAADSASDGGGGSNEAAAPASCPPNSTCQATTVAGPDCLP
jgi:hypothetical protein